VCSISEGQENAVYFIAQRLIGGAYVYYQERLASRNMGSKPELGVPADLSKAWFVDCGLQYPLTYPNATLTPVSTGGAATPLPAVVYSIVGTDIIAGGSGYTAPTGTIIDQNGTGTGASISFTVVGGVITGATVVPGKNYQRPVISINDATGSGAVVQAILSNDVVMNASGAIIVNVGDMVRINNGWGPIRLVNSATQITVNVQQPLLNLWPAAANAWSATTPVTVISGLDHLNGQTVAILADGNVQPQQVVSSGSVTLQEPATAIVAGLPMVAQLQSLYLDIPGESPTVQGRRKKISAVTARVADTRGLKIGHDFITMNEFKERAFQAMGQQIMPITGDERVIIDPLWDVAAQLCLQQDNPLPATLLGLIPEVSVGDTVQ
jgi:hypothetical protein